MRMRYQYAKRESEGRDSNHFNPQDEPLICESADLILDFISEIDGNGVHSVKFFIDFHDFL